MGKELSVWQLLPLKKKNELLNIYVRSGYTSLNAIKLHYNLFADGGYVGNYGEVSSEIKHNVQHMNQPFFYNNNPSNAIHREDFNSFSNGGFINSSTLELNNLNTLYNIFAEGGNSAPRMLLRPVPQSINTLLFKRNNTPVLPINHLITTPSNTKQVVTPKVTSRNSSYINRVRKYGEKLKDAK